jgi:hypothetical protein
MSDKFLKIIAGGFTVGLIGLLKVCTKNIDSIGHSVAKSSDDMVRNSTEMVEHGAPRALRIAGREYAQDDESNNYSADASASTYSAPSDVRDETTYKNYLRQLGRVSFELDEMESTNAQVSLDVEDYYKKILIYQHTKHQFEDDGIENELRALSADTSDRELIAGFRYQLRLILAQAFINDESNKAIDSTVEMCVKEWKESKSEIRKMESYDKLDEDIKTKLNEFKKTLKPTFTKLINEHCFQSYYPFHKKVADSIFARNHLK